jgi:hypothetical protein
MTVSGDMSGLMAHQAYMNTSANKNSLESDQTQESQVPPPQELDEVKSSLAQNSGFEDAKSEIEIAEDLTAQLAAPSGFTENAPINETPDNVVGALLDVKA